MKREAILAWICDAGTVREDRCNGAIRVRKMRSLLRLRNLLLLLLYRQIRLRRDGTARKSRGTDNRTAPQYPVYSPVVFRSGA